MNNILKFDTSFCLIQQIRLAHAICESKFLVSITPSEIYKLQNLKRKFRMHFVSSNEVLGGLSAHIEIDHTLPKTSIGAIHRPLVFPHAITQYCKSIWNEARPTRYTFTGLITESRKLCLQKFITNNVKTDSFQELDFETPFFKIRKRIFSLFGIDNSIRKEIGDLVICSSTRGRKYPEKSWDEGYYKELAESAFVLCPSGDYVWSYRFFEAILCGAIPIIEENCAAYEGFKFFYMHDMLKDTSYSRADAEYNYQLCLKRITIPTPELNRELEAIANSYAQHENG
ncbi:exostosin family protein [Hymenobacter sp. BT683]|uniref:Exostosin family protein n=1 Tax=Hymenobacter jeongseonensis TaxID=2791027 RepID=A0ABS0INJ1_9BACT|nr:exostosin family protein [Hymenobacter jeongseonensis]MBF9239931.1 exostosin family protein [Hymenobacter jeongseonensis]